MTDPIPDLRRLLAAYPFTRPWSHSIFKGQIDDGRSSIHSYSDAEIKARRELIIGAVNALGPLLDRVERAEKTLGDCVSLLRTLERSPENEDGQISMQVVEAADALGGE